MTPLVQRRPPPLPRSLTRSANDNAVAGAAKPSHSVRVPARSAPQPPDSAEEREWRALALRAKARLDDEEREWQTLRARAEAAARIDEEREWRAAIARAQAALCLEEEQAWNLTIERARAAARLEEEREWQRRMALARVSAPLAPQPRRAPPGLPARPTGHARRAP